MPKKNVILTILARIFGGRLYMSAPLNSAHKDEIVILAHGLIRRSRCMRKMGSFLNKHGYAVYLYDYDTTTRSIGENGKIFAAFIKKVIAENAPDAKIHFVTHSMGGIILRFALKILGKEQQIGRIVMLAPPNHGSATARRLLRFLPFTRRWPVALKELSNAEDSSIHQLFVPEYPEIGIVAGRFDFQVSVKSSYLNGMKDHTVILCEHSFMMYMPRAKRLALKFLESGSFHGA